MAAGIVLEGGHWRVMGRRARAHPLSVHCPVPARVSPGRLRERAHVGHLQSTTSVTGNTRACLLQLGVSGQRHGRPLAPSRTPSSPPLLLLPMLHAPIHVGARGPGVCALGPPQQQAGRTGAVGCVCVGVGETATTNGQMWPKHPHIFCSLLPSFCSNVSPVHWWALQDFSGRWADVHVWKSTRSSLLRGKRQRPHGQIHILFPEQNCRIRNASAQARPAGRKRCRI